MARNNDLKLTPNHESQLPPMAATSPGEGTQFNGPDVLGDEVQFFSGSEGHGDISEAPPEEELKVTVQDPNQQDDVQDVEIEEEDEADGLAGIINDSSLSGINHQSPKITSTPVASIIGRLRGLWSGTPRQQPQAIQGSANPHIQTETQQDSEKLVESTAKSPSAVARKTSLPIDVADKATNPRNRSSASSRPDIYEVPPSPPRSPAIEIKTKNDTKRKASKPNKLVVRERAKKGVVNAYGDAFQENLGEERQKQTELLREPRPAIVMEMSPTVQQITTPKRITKNTRVKEDKSMGHSDRSEEVHHQALERSPELGQPLVSQTEKSKVRRGRPRKGQNDRIQQEEPTSGPAVASNPSILKYANTKRRNRKFVESDRTHDNVEEEIQVRATAESEQVVAMEAAGELNTNDVSNILMNPSPIKATQQRPLLLHGTGKGLHPARTGIHLQRENGGTSSQHSIERHQELALHRPRIPENGRIQAQNYQPKKGGDDESDDFIATSDINNHRTPPPNAESVVKSLESFIDEEVVESMHSTMDHVGQNAYTHERVAPDKAIRTPLGRQMSRAADKLTQSYRLLEVLKSADVVDLEKFDTQRQKVSALLAKLNELTDTLLKDRLGDRSTGGKNGDDTSRTNVLEDLYMHVIPKIVEAFYTSAKKYSKHPSLDTGDLEELMALLKIIFVLAKAARAEKKEIQPKAPKSKTYSIAMPTIRILPLVRGLIRKCHKELAARQFEDARRAAAARARKRKELSDDQERADEEAYLRRLNERNKAILISLDRSRARLGLPPSSQQADAEISSQPCWDLADDDEFSDESDDHDHGRLSIFDRNNSHPERIPREWTREEMEILVDGLWRERGPTRYEKLAMRLDRTMDEIFGRATYFKEQVQHTINRKLEENPDVEHARMEPWVENIGHEF